jgi:hypothetical protein
MDTSSLIASLAANARPVRRLRAPALRAALWLLFAGSIIGALVLDHGMRPDLVRRFSQTSFVLEWAGSLSTAILAAFAAFYISLPGRSGRWAWLPVPALILWSGSMGQGCYADWLHFGAAGLTLGTSFDCLRFIAATTVPLAALLLFLLRYAAPIRPVSTTLMATLSVSALAASGQSLMHDLDTTIMVLAWHVGTVTLLLLAARFAGPHLLRVLYRPLLS